MARHIRTGRLPPVTAIICGTDRDPRGSQSTIDDVANQLYDNWKAIVVGGDKARSHADSRIDLVAGDFGLTRCIQKEPDKEDRIYIIIPAGVRLRPYAFYMFAAYLASQETALLAYSDEDVIDSLGRRMQPLFKPEFSPELYRSYRFTGSCVAARWSLLGGDPARTADIKEIEAKLLSMSPPGARQAAVHVPFVLYHAPPELAPRMEKAQRPAITGSHSVSIIILTKDKGDLLRSCIESIQPGRQGPFGRVEIVVVDNGSTDTRTLAYLEELARDGRARLLVNSGPFNYSRLNNLAASQCGSDVLVFLNNDTEVLDDTWLEQLAAYALQPDVAAVGPKMLFMDRTVQHGGAVLGNRRRGRALARGTSG